MGDNLCINFLFIIYASRTIFIGNTDFGDQTQLEHIIKFSIFHINLATIGGVLGLIQIITTYKDKFKWHRKAGPIASVIWFFAYHWCSSLLTFICILPVEKRLH